MDFCIYYDARAYFPILGALGMCNKGYGVSESSLQQNTKDATRMAGIFRCLENYSFVGNAPVPRSAYSTRSPWRLVQTKLLRAYLLSCTDEKTLRQKGLLTSTSLA